MERLKCTVLEYQFAMLLVLEYICMLCYITSCTLTTNTIDSHKVDSVMLKAAPRYAGFISSNECFASTNALYNSLKAGAENLSGSAR